MNARRRSLDKWKDDSDPLNSKENGGPTALHSSPSVDHPGSFSSHLAAQFTVPNDNNNAYGTPSTDAIIPSFCGPTGSHINFPASHHLHTYGLQQPPQQYIGQTSQMIGCSSLSSTSLIHGYQTQAPVVPQPAHIISHRWIPLCVPEVIYFWWNLKRPKTRSAFYAATHLERARNPSWLKKFYA